MRRVGCCRAVLAAAMIAILIAGLPAYGDAENTVPSPAGWNLVWNDEFEGNAIDRSKWSFDIGNGFYAYHANQWISGWGNNELQYYTGEPDNAFVRDGMLHIRAIRESLHGCGYTSARLKTCRKDGTALFSQAYGRFEFRARLPLGRGIWPALWMLPEKEAYGPWPASGEIDIVEARGQDPTRVIGSLHFGSRWPANTHVSSHHSLPDSTIAEFHIYAVEWEPGEIRWYVDGQQFAEQAFWWSCSKTTDGRGVNPQSESDLNAWPAPFNQPFYIIMNVAVGGRFPGNPDNTTAFPAEMVVDYVRVYEKAGGYGSLPGRGDGPLPFTGRP